MDKRKIAKDNVEYQQLDRDILYNCKVEKEEWLNTKCSEIENQKHKNIFIMYENIKNLTRAEGCTSISSGCFKAKNGKILKEKEQVLETWNEYIEELWRQQKRKA